MKPLTLIISLALLGCEKKSETATWQSAPTDGTVFKYKRPGEAEVVLKYEDGTWRTVKEVQP